MNVGPVFEDVNGERGPVFESVNVEWWTGL